jgi:hypothetical protein
MTAKIDGFAGCMDDRAPMTAVRIIRVAGWHRDATWSVGSTLHRVRGPSTEITDPHAGSTRSSGLRRRSASPPPRIGWRW